MHRIKPKREIIFSKCRYAYGVPYVINGEMLDKIISNYGEGSIERLDKQEGKDRVPDDFKNWSRILVVRGGGIGNYIEITPFLSELKSLLPNADIDIYCDKLGEQVLEGNKNINKIHTSPPEDTYDKIYHTYPHALVYKSKKHIQEFNKNHVGLYSEARVNLNMLLPLGYIDGKQIPSEIYIPDKIKKSLAGKFRGKKYIGLCPGYIRLNNRWDVKHWGDKNYKELIFEINRKFIGYKIIVIGGKDDDIGWPSSVINCCGKYSIKESAYILSRCDFVIGNDTGMVHVASAVGVPGYTIFTATDRVKNLTSGMDIIEKEGLDCSPCQFSEKNWLKCEDHKCREISVDYAIGKISKRLDVRKFKIGIIMPIYNRYDILVPVLLNIQGCCKQAEEKLKFVFVDDRSTDIRIQERLSEFKIAIESDGHYVEIIKMPRNCGYKEHWQVQKKGLDNCSNCEYVFFYPQDFIINFNGFSVLKKHRGLLKNDVNILIFFKDMRNDLKGNYSIDLKWCKRINDWFYQVKIWDGAFGLMRYDFASSLDWEHPSYVGESIWYYISGLLRERGKLLRYCKSIGEHIGNTESAMHPDWRKIVKITGIGVDLFSDLEEVRANVVEQGGGINKNYWVKRYSELGGRRTVGNKWWTEEQYNDNNKRFFDFIDKNVFKNNAFKSERIKKILDYGFGIGRCYDFLYNKFPGIEYHAMDIVDNRQGQDVKFQLVKEDGTFEISEDINLIWTWVVLQHIVDPKLLEYVFSQFSNALQKGGYLIITEATYGSNLEYITCRDKIYYMELMARNNFIILDVKKFDENHTMFFGVKE